MAHCTLPPARVGSSDVSDHRRAGISPPRGRSVTRRCRGEHFRHRSVTSADAARRIYRQCASVRGSACNDVNMTVKPSILDTRCATRARARRRPGPARGAVVAALALPSAAAARAPPPPGPPPGAGRDLPAPPGTAPAFVPAGTPAAIPSGAVGPGLLDGRGARVDPRARRVSLALACRRNGTVTVTASLPAPRTIARGRLRCRGLSGTAVLGLSPADARRLRRAGTVPAR